MLLANVINMRLSQAILGGMRRKRFPAVGHRFSALCTIMLKIAGASTHETRLAVHTATKYAPETTKLSHKRASTSHMGASSRGG